MKELFSPDGTERLPLGTDPSDYILPEVWGIRHPEGSETYPARLNTILPLPMQSMPSSRFTRAVHAVDNIQCDQCQKTSQRKQF